MGKAETISLDIFLPFFGDLKYLKETVASVLSQDSDSWQLTIVNDAHWDFSVDNWIERLNHPKINYLRNASNLGLSRNLLRCLEYSTANHCVFLGCDDVLLPNFVSTITSQIERTPRVALIQPGVRVINDSGENSFTMVDQVKKLLSRVAGLGKVRNRRVIASLLIGDWMYFPSIVWRTDLVKEFGFDPNLYVCQDLDLTLKVLNAPGEVVIMVEELFLYRRHSQSLSSVKLINGERFLEEKQLHYKWARNYFKQFQFLLGILASAHLTSRFHALILMPRSFGSWKSLLACFKHLFT